MSLMKKSGPCDNPKGNLKKFEFSKHGGEGTLGYGLLIQLNVVETMSYVKGCEEFCSLEEGK